MKFDLHPTQFLGVSQIADLTSQLDVLHTRVLKAIDRLNNDVTTRKAEIANRWKQMDAISDSDRRRLAEQETSKVIQTIKANSQKEIDGLMKEAGRLHAQITDQRPFYASKAMVLNRAGIGTAERANMEQTAKTCRPAALAGLMQYAIGTNNPVMAAVALQKNDSRRDSDRGFASQEALSLLTVQEFDKAHEYMKLADVRLQGIVLAVRTWTMGKSSPIDTVALALRKQTVDASILEDGDHA